MELLVVQLVETELVAAAACRGAKRRNGDGIRRRKLGDRKGDEAEAVALSRFGIRPDILALLATVADVSDGKNGDLFAVDVYLVGDGETCVRAVGEGHVKRGAGRSLDFGHGGAVAGNSGAETGWRGCSRKAHGAA